MKLLNTIKKVALTLGLLTVGYIAGNIETEQPQAESNNVKQSLNEIKSGERNVFSQYFTITKLDEKGAEVVNRYNENDTYYINKEEFNLEFETLKTGEPIVVTFDHDTTLDAVRDEKLIRQYELEDNEDIDNTKYIYGVSTTHTNETIVLDREGYKEGDIVNVTFKDDIHDNIHNVAKVGNINE